MSSQSKTAQQPVSGKNADKVFKGVAYACGILILVVLAAVALFLLFRAWPLIGGDQQANSDTISNFTGGKASSFWGYVGPLLFGTVLISALALLISFFVSVGIALFISHYAPFFVSGAEMTLFISVFGIILAIVVGLVCAGIEIARIPVLRQVVRVYIELSRNTPLLVQLYFLYFGLPKLGLVWSAELCAIVGLGFLGGSYMAEAMRGGLETIPEVQRESAYVLGLSKWQTLSRVVIPQAISTSIPGVVANVIFLIKESSVVSAIALADVMYMAKDLIGMYYDTYESLFLLIVAYLVILLPISIFGTWLERRFDYERR